MLNKALCKKCYDANRVRPWDKFNRIDKKTKERYSQKDRTWGRGRMVCVAILDVERKIRYIKTDEPPPRCCYYFLEQTLIEGEREMKVGPHTVLIDPEGFGMGNNIVVRPGWAEEGKKGMALASSVIINRQSWTPVLWEDEEGEDAFGFHKTAALKKRT